MSGMRMLYGGPPPAQSRSDAQRAVDYVRDLQGLGELVRSLEAKIDEANAKLDALTKSRKRPGHAKLDEEKMAKARRLLEDGVSLRETARVLGVSHPALKQALAAQEGR